MLSQEPDRETVREALQKAFPYQPEAIKEMRWSGIDNCWLWHFCGMTVGIETDGYVHS